jgi:hypothetical protein
MKTMARWTGAVLAAVLLAGCGEKESMEERVAREAREIWEKAGEEVAEQAEAEKDPRREFFQAMIRYLEATERHQLAKEDAKYDPNRPQAEWIMAREAEKAAEAAEDAARDEAHEAERQLREADQEGWVALKNWQGEWFKRETKWQTRHFRIHEGQRAEIEREWMEIQGMTLEEALALGAGMTTADR